MKILFISHDSSHTGATLLLLQFIEWLGLNKDCSIQIIILDDGLLSKDFSKLGKVKIINRNRNLLKRLITYALKKFTPSIHKWIIKYRIKRFIKPFNPDLVYANSVVSLKLINEIKKAGDFPVLCHVHELEYGIDNYLGSSIFSSYVPFIDKFIANSKATKNNLINNYKIPSEKVNIVQPHIQFNNSQVSKNIFKELSVDNETFIIMGCGWINWFKGIELFIYAASELANRTDKKFKFVWIGGNNQDYLKKLTNEIRILGLEEKVEFLGFRENASEYFKYADAFFISSREESFGMVGLESALKGVPVICFDTSQGMKEFIGEDAGFVVPYPDYKAAADRMLELMHNPELKEKLGNEGRKRVLEKANIETTGSNIWSYIEEVVRRTEK